VIRRAACVLALLTLVGAVACSDSPSSGSVDSEAAIKLLPEDTRGPFPLVDDDGLTHGWVAVSPSGDAATIIKTFEKNGVDFGHEGATKGGWITVEDDDTSARVAFDTRGASSASGAACVDRVEHDTGTPRQAVESRTDALGMVHFVTQHGQWRGGPSAYASVRVDEKTRLVFNAISVKDGSLVLLSTCK
jgi:hypothetical protein